MDTLGEKDSALLTREEANARRMPTKYLGDIRISASYASATIAEQGIEYAESFQMGPSAFVDEEDTSHIYEPQRYAGYLFLKPKSLSTDFTNACVARRIGSEDYEVIRVRPFTVAGVGFNATGLVRVPYVGHTGNIRTKEGERFSQVTPANVEMFVNVFRATRPYNPLVFLSSQFSRQMGPPFMVIQCTPTGSFAIIAKTAIPVPRNVYAQIQKFETEVPRDWLFTSAKLIDAVVQSPRVANATYNLNLHVKGSVPEYDSFAMTTEVPPPARNLALAGAKELGHKHDYQRLLEEHNYVTVAIPNSINGKGLINLTDMASDVIKWHHPAFRAFDAWLRDLFGRLFSSYLPHNSPSGHTWELSIEPRGVYNLDQHTPSFFNALWPTTRNRIHVMLYIGGEEDAEVKVTFNIGGTDTDVIVTKGTCLAWSGITVVDVDSESNVYMRYTDIVYHDMELTDTEMFKIANRLEQMQVLAPLTESIQLKDPRTSDDTVRAYTEEELLLYVPQRHWPQLGDDSKLDPTRELFAFSPDIST